jgi:transposase-like protein
MALLFTGCHSAQGLLILPFGFASSLRRETRLQDWTHRYALSYRDLEKMVLERGVEVDHTTLYRWVQVYAPELDKRLRPHRLSTSRWGKVDETYVKVKGMWNVMDRFFSSMKASEF